MHGIAAHTHGLKVEACNLGSTDNAGSAVGPSRVARACCRDRVVDDVPVWVERARSQRG